MRDQQTLCSHMARTHGVKDNHQSFQQHQTQWQNQQQAGNNNGGGHFHSIDCSANINVEGTLMNLADGSNNAFASNSNQIPPVPAPSDLASAQASLNSSANPPHAFSSTLETPTTVSSSKAFQMTTTVGTTIAETPGSSSASAATASLATTLTATASKTTTGSADIGKSKSSTDNPNSTLEDRISSKEVPVTDEDKSQFPTEINFGAAENSSSVKIPEHLPSIKDNSSDTLDPNNKGSASTVPTECIVVPTAPNNSSSKDLTDEPEQSCFDCNLTFRSGLDLKKHIDLAHKGRRAKGTLYQCLVCSEKFQDKTSHKEHMDAHAREKPFK